MSPPSSPGPTTDAGRRRRFAIVGLLGLAVVLLAGIVAVVVVVGGQRLGWIRDHRDWRVSREYRDWRDGRDGHGGREGGGASGAQPGSLAGSSSRPGETADSGSLRRDLNQLIAEQLDAELQFSPTLATWLGDHSSDDRLDDVRIETISREMARLDAMADRLRRFGEQLTQFAGAAGAGAAGATALATDSLRLDFQLLQARVEAKRLELSDARPFERNPIFYTNLIAFGLDSLIGPNLLTLSGMRALRGRLAQVAAICREAQRTLKNPPEVFTRRAIETAQATRDFVALLLPRMLANITLPDSALLDDVNRQREGAERALEDFTAWLGRDLLSRSKGDWSQPRERFLTRLRAVELVDVPLDTLQNLVEFEHREARRRFDELSRKLTGPSSMSPSRAATEALRAVEEDHPKPEELLRAAESALDKAIEMTASQKFVTPPDVRPQVTEMPAYRFGYVMLSMPALLEPERQALFYIDPVDPSWKDRKRITDHLRLLNRAQLLHSALHEVVPGHFTQQTVARRLASGLPPIRMRTLSTAFLEGWSHYAEKTLLENAPPPGAVSERLQQLSLRLELLRLGRLLAAIRLHAPPYGAPPAGARLEDAVRFFVEECYLDEYAARREAERLTYDPLAGLGALGQLQLEQLRRDYQAEQGTGFANQAFHDALLMHGALPVVALRRLILSRQVAAGPSLQPPAEPPPSPLLDDGANP
jgi:hypothetical protein